VKKLPKILLQIRILIVMFRKKDFGGYLRPPYMIKMKTLKGARHYTKFNLDYEGFLSFLTGSNTLHRMRLEAFPFRAKSKSAIN